MVLLCATLTAPCARAQEWPLSALFATPSKAPMPPRPLQPMALPASSWHVTVERAGPPAPPVRPADPRWTATITYAAIPYADATPLVRRVPRMPTPVTGKGHELDGIASFYWQNQKTASGEQFDRHGFTAAHKTLPMNARVRVTNVVNGRTVIVRINDRGPFKPGRVIDLSEAAAISLDMQRMGLAPVKLQVLPN